jgi:hypothetical protein
MSVEEERLDHFTAWRVARRGAVSDETQYTVCEMLVRDLLSTLEPSSQVRIKLEGTYNREFSRMLRDFRDSTMAYVKRKKPSTGAAAIAFQEARRLEFWNQMYDLFYYEFKHNTLIRS